MELFRGFSRISSTANVQFVRRESEHVQEIATINIPFFGLKTKNAPCLQHEGRSAVYTSTLVVSQGVKQHE